MNLALNARFFIAHWIDIPRAFVTGQKHLQEIDCGHERLSPLHDGDYILLICADCFEVRDLEPIEVVA